MVRIRRSEDNLWELFLFFYHKFQGQNLGLYVEVREQNGEFSFPFYHVYSGDGTQVVQLAGKPKHSVFLYSQYPELYRWTQNRILRTEVCGPFLSYFLRSLCSQKVISCCHGCHVWETMKYIAASKTHDGSKSYVIRNIAPGNGNTCYLCFNMLMIGKQNCYQFKISRQFKFII